MTYPGNPSLARDVQQRVLDTFGQTLDLAHEGSRQEALLGCDFVLRMDPQFDPARRLQERLRSSAGAVVDIDDLRAAVDPAGQVVPADLFADLDGLGLELPDLPRTGVELRDELTQLLEQRRFEELMALAEREKTLIFSEPLLQGIVQEAQSRAEAAPYAEKFLASARAALQAGNREEARRHLEKVRALDASHPELAELDAGAAEEDLLGAFDLSFDSPSLDPTLFGGAGTGSGYVESDPRIRALLDEGQKAFDGGDPQGGIDAWSRIFLIDIDHQEAARRIEQARKLKAESERQVEEIFHDGVAKLEAGDMGAARQAFQQVLEIQPGYLAAREYLQQLDAGKTPVVTPAARPAHRDGLAGAPESLLQHGVDPADDLKEEIMVPPEPGAQAAKATERRPAKAAAVRERRPAKLFALVGSAVLLIVLAGGWFVWQNRDRFFPNSQAEKTPAPGADPIARATELIKKREGAPTSPEPGATPGGPLAASTPAPPVVPPERQAALDAAHQAYAEGSYLRAAEILSQAASTGKLDESDAGMLERAKLQIEPLAKQIGLFRDHEWEFVIPDLWKMREKLPPSRDIDRLLIDSYYNLGVRDLQRADANKAAEKFQEALKLSPEDPLMRRHMLFAQTYKERPKDLLYGIYVRYLTYR